MSGHPYAQADISLARQIISSPLDTSLKISGLPDSPRLLALSLPLLYFYIALIYRATVRKIKIGGIDSSEPWILITATTLLERTAVLMWVVAMILSGFFVFIEFAAYDPPTSYRLARLIAYLEDSDAARMTARWIEDSNQPSRQGTVEDFPVLGAGVATVCLFGVVSVFLASLQAATLSRTWRRSTSVRTLINDVRTVRRSLLATWRRTGPIRNLVVHFFSPLLVRLSNASTRFLKFWFWLSFWYCGWLINHPYFSPGQKILDTFMSCMTMGCLFGIAYNFKMLSGYIWRSFLPFQALYFLKNCATQSRAVSLYLREIMEQTYLTHAPKDPSYSPKLFLILMKTGEVEATSLSITLFASSAVTVSLSLWYAWHVDRIMPSRLGEKSKNDKSKLCRLPTFFWGVITLFIVIQLTNMIINIVYLVRQKNIDADSISIFAIDISITLLVIYVASSIRKNLSAATRVLLIAAFAALACWMLDLTAGSSNGPSDFARFFLLSAMYALSNGGRLALNDCALPPTAKDQSVVPTAVGLPAVLHEKTDQSDGRS
jgi:hypothetical protein